MGMHEHTASGISHYLIFGVRLIPVDPSQTTTSQLQFALRHQPSRTFRYKTNQDGRENDVSTPRPSHRPPVQEPTLQKRQHHTQRGVSGSERDERSAHVRSSYLCYVHYGRTSPECFFKNTLINYKLLLN